MYSPSSINTYFACPRLYYFKYIKKYPQFKSIHLYKGSLVHGILENLFMSTKYRKNMKRWVVNQLNKQWNPKEDGIEDTDEERHKKECELMLLTFVNRLQAQIELAKLQNNVHDENHAWNLLKPRFREHKIVNHDLELHGIIDAINDDYSGRTFIIDYKTSKRYKHFVTEQYIRQLSLYALLYYKEYNELPDFVGVDYLRYGETILFPVSMDMIKLAEKDLDFVKQNTQSTDKEDYPKKCHLTGNKFCDCYKYEEKYETTDN